MLVNMRLCFLINPSEDWQQAVEHARHLALAALKTHQITAVFFFGSAAKIIQDTSMQQRWNKLNSCDLWICRTMIDQWQLNETACHNHFSVTGMAPWIDCMQQSDRVIEII